MSLPHLSMYLSTYSWYAVNLPQALHYTHTMRILCRTRVYMLALLCAGTGHYHQ